MKKLKLYATVDLIKHDDGTFEYTDTYGETHQFHDKLTLWQHLAYDGEEFKDLEAFIFGE